MLVVVAVGKGLAKVGLVVAVGEGVTKLPELSVAVGVAPRIVICDRSGVAVDVPACTAGNTTSTVKGADSPATLARL